MISKPNEKEIQTMFYIEQCIKTLYKFECSGGCCHIVTDDYNITDEDLKWVIDFCQKEENSDRPDRFLSKCICEQLLTLKIDYRIILFDMMEQNIFSNIDSEKIDLYFLIKNPETVVNDYKEIYEII